jgi:hypothetical protein
MSSRSTWTQHLKDAARDIFLLSVMPIRARFQETPYQSTWDTVFDCFCSSYCNNDIPRTESRTCTLGVGRSNLTPQSEQLDSNI